MIINKDIYENKDGKTVKTVKFIFNEKNVIQSKSGKAYICSAFFDETVDTVAGEIELSKLIKLDLLKDSKTKLEYLTDSINNLTDDEKKKLKALLK